VLLIASLFRDFLRRLNSALRPRVLVRLSGVLALAAGAFQTARGEPGAAEEYQQKAGLICNFLRQCKWPDRRFAAPNAPFIVGVYGSDQISGFLRENIQDRLIQGRAVQIRRITMKEELPTCHLVFVAKSERDRLKAIIGETRRGNVLTVGECDNFLASGGVIQFTSYAGQVRYQLSLDAARRERIEPGGFVLRMALPQSAVRRADERRLADTLNP